MDNNTFYSNIKFNLNSNSFNHNQESDLACFALWKEARPFVQKIRDYLHLNFEVLLDTEIEWSEENFHQNASRLYEVPLFGNVPKSKLLSSHAKKIGDNKFVFIVVKDKNPVYSYAMSVSKKIELSNLNIVKAKYAFRDWIVKETGSKYAVHSTNNIQEFYFQAPLILGVNRFYEIVKGNVINEKLIIKDLEGANGWNNWKEVFEILNISCNYIVLRNFEDLPLENPDKDIDMLTDNYQRVASALGLIQRPSKSYKGHLLVQNEEIPFDIRFVGDKYYDVSWEKDMLETKISHNGVFVPRKDNHFFSLLYHSKIQKKSVKEKYYKILSDLSVDLKFNWYSDEIIKSDELTGEALSGFFRANNYFYENPIDDMVYRNKPVIAYLPSLNSEVSKDTFKAKLKRFLVKILPINVFLYLKKLKNKFVK